MSKVKCRYCKKNIDKESAFSPREKLYFCDQECYNEWRKSDDGQLDALLDYVWGLYSPSKQTSSTYIMIKKQAEHYHNVCLLYTSPSPRDSILSRMPSSA